MGFYQPVSVKKRLILYIITGKKEQVFRKLSKISYNIYITNRLTEPEIKNHVSIQEKENKLWITANTDIGKELMDLYLSNVYFL